MEVNIKIGRRAKALDEGDGTGLSLGMGQAGLVDHKGREGPVNDLHDRGKQVRLGGEQMPQVRTFTFNTYPEPKHYLMFLNPVSKLC